VHLTAKFHHPTFNRSEVIMLTNKQTDAAEDIHLAPLSTPVGKYKNKATYLFYLGLYTVLFQFDGECKIVENNINY